jgi:hypothetical protein
LPDFIRRTSAFCFNRRLRSGGLVEQGGSDLEAAIFCLGGDVFQRSGQTCPAGIVQHVLLAVLWLAVMRIAVALAVGGCLRRWPRTIAAVTTTANWKVLTWRDA